MDIKIVGKESRTAAREFYHSKSIKINSFFTTRKSLRTFVGSGSRKRYRFGPANVWGDVESLKIVNSIAVDYHSDYLMRLPLGLEFGHSREDEKLLKVGNTLRFSVMNLFYGLPISIINLNSDQTGLEYPVESLMAIQAFQC